MMETEILDQNSILIQQKKRVQELNQMESLFETVIHKSYLERLSSAYLIPPGLEKEPKMSWFKITKIVYEKDVFFVDKLSMLYSSLHKESKQVALVLKKDRIGKIDLYLGARDFSGVMFTSGEILKAGLQGFLPGISIEDHSQLDCLDEESSDLSVAGVSGVASLRDDKKDKFVQGVERLINSTLSIPKFTALFLADSISKDEQANVRDAYENIYSAIQPLVQTQMTFTEGNSESVAESLTEGITNTISKNVSRTITDGTSKSENSSVTNSYTTTKGSSISKNSPDAMGRIGKGLSVLSGTVGATVGAAVGAAGIVAAPAGMAFGGLAMFGSVIGGMFGGSKSKSSSTSEAKGKSNTEGKTTGSTRSEGNQTGESSSRAVAQSETKGTTNQVSTGKSFQITSENKKAKELLESIDSQLKRMKRSEAFGLWSCATYFIANSSTTANKLANIYKGCVIGEQSGIESYALNCWDGPNANGIIRYLNKSMHPRFLVDGLNVSPGSMVDSEELAIHMSLPQSSVPGIIVKEKASFGRVVTCEEGIERAIDLGHVIHLDDESDRKNKVILDAEELSKHTFITGTTGSGKSNAIYLLLNKVKEHGCKFMVVEPAKGEYKNVFGGLDDVYIYGTNPKLTPLLRINPFEFPESIHILEHIDRLIEIFNACWPMYAAMPAVLKKSIEMAYEQCGWDMLNSENLLGVYPTIRDVKTSLARYMDDSQFDGEVRGNYRGALETRLDSLQTGVFEYIFSSDSLSDEELFNENVIIDLSRLGSLETKSLIMGMLVLKLNEFRMSENLGMNLKLRHVTVLEEAHNLLKRTSTEQSADSSNLAGKSVEMISNSIAEMRTYGEGFIIADQSPSMLDLSAIRNTNTKIVMALPDHQDREAVGKAMGLSDQQIEEISRQKKGQAIVYQNSWEEAVQCKINLASFESKPYNLSPQKRLNSLKSSPLSNDILTFLLPPYCSGFDIDEIKKTIFNNSLLPSSLKYSLLELTKEFESTKNLSLWEENNSKEREELLRIYLDTEGKIKKKIENNPEDLNEILIDFMRKHNLDDDYNTMRQVSKIFY